MSDIIYKYLAPSRADIFESKTIRFTQPILFNDLFESKPHLSYGLTLKEIKRAFIKMWTESGWPKDAIKNFENNVSPEYLKGFSSLSHDRREQIYADLGSGVGVLSLTERPDSLLMWAHYAQSHEGFVIGFDPRHSFFSNKKKQGQVGRLQKVVYSINRPNRSLKSVTVFDVYLTKSKEWAYEQELRLLRYLDKPDKTIETELLPICLYHLPPSCIRKVILGCRIMHSVRDNISMILKEDADYKHVKLSEASVSADKYIIFTE